MANGLEVVLPPAGPVYRISRGTDLFVPAPWDIADPDDGTFRGRFDDPGKLTGIAESQRFRIIYCASQRTGAFAETIVRFRLTLDALSKLQEVSQSKHCPFVSHTLFDPDDPARGIVTATWRLRRRIGSALLDQSLRFVDIASPQTMNHLRSVLAPAASSLGFQDVDLSTMTGYHRLFTQLCARYVYERRDERGAPVFAGIRYVSRLNPNWECWAIFDTRMVHQPRDAEAIETDDPDLVEVGALFGLSIEGDQPGQYLRP